jgi:hypothetical protein
MITYLVLKYLKLKLFYLKGKNEFFYLKGKNEFY